MIRGNDKIEIYHDKKDGLDWLKFTCAIWVKYNYKQVKKLLKSKDGHKKISVEIEVNDYEIDEKGIEIIKDFTFDGVTILGDNLETGIADANLTILDMIDNALFQKKQKCLCYAYDTLNKNEVPESREDIVDGQSSDKENFQANDVPNEGVGEIEMDQENQEGGKQKMLTYETKRSLLESYLCENLKKEQDECPCYTWVCDLDDTYVYFITEETYYRARYSIVQSDEDENASYVVIDLDEKEQVIRTWSTFASEVADETVDALDNSEEVYEAEAESVEGASNDETMECDTQEEVLECGDKEINEESDDSSSDEANDNNENSGNIEDEAEPEVQSVEEYSNDTFEGQVELNDEPSDVDTEDVSTEEIIAESTESIVAPEVQTEPENLGDANAEVVETLGEEVEEVVADDSLNEISSEVSKGPAGEEAEVVEEEEEDSSKVQQPDDNDKEKLFEVVTVELDGENVDINSLLEKYNSLKYQYDTLAETIKTQNAKALAKFGADFINADSEVDSESKNAYIALVNEKCESFEFTSEDEVEKFAKGLLAMYYYENRVSRKESSDFSISLEHNVHVDKPASKNKLKEAINKLNCI